LHGSLDDFYSISLDEAEPTFLWQEIAVKGKCHPGRRSKHALLGGKDKIYLIGGLKANDEASNEIYEFDPKTSEWTLVKPEGVKLPALESFSSALLSSAEEKIIIAFGFNEELASPSNAIYEYNIPKNKLSILFEGTKTAKQGKNIIYIGFPSPRVGSAITTDNNHIFIFGGKDENSRLNDIWSFSLTDFKFARLKDEGEIPAVRNGHTMNYHDG
jgi:N-acetylneuraminic acid mutarotase